MAPPKKKKSNIKKTVAAGATASAKEGDASLREKALEVAIKALKKKMDGVVIDWLSDVPTSDHTVVSTGSLALDSALGVGGVVLGRVYEFFGHEASGKSTLAFSVLVNAVTMGMRCLLIDAEQTFDKRLFIDMGGDPEKVVIVRAYTGEENLDIAEAMMASGAFDICVIDSVAALVPTAETDQDSYSDQSMGLHARLMSKMCRNMVPVASKTKTALILINQTRSTIGGYGDPTVTTGGNSIPFYATVRVKVKGGKSKSSRILNMAGTVIGHTTEFTVVKNKLAAPYRTAKVNLIYGKGYDTTGELADLGVDIGLIDQAGAWFTLGEERIQGRANLAKYLSDNKKAANSLRKEIHKILGIPTNKKINTKTSTTVKDE